jgi:HEPN domain-containing protein
MVRSFQYTDRGAISCCMEGRARDWLRQAGSDLDHARHAFEDGDHDWACFAAQQAVEKAAHQALGQEAWGHSVTELLEALRDRASGIDELLMDRARALDKFYVTTRYPNGLPAGAPVDYFTAGEAERAIRDAEAIIVVCTRVLQG